MNRKLRLAYLIVNACAFFLAALVIFPAIFSRAEPHEPSNFSLIAALILAGANMPFAFYVAKREYQKEKDPLWFVFVLVGYTGLSLLGFLHGAELVERYFFR